MPPSYPSPPVYIQDIPVAFYIGDGTDPAPIREAWIEGQGLVVQIDFLVRWSDRIRFLQILSGSSSYSAPSYSRTLPANLPQIIGDKSPGLPGQVDDYQWYRFICTSTGEFTPKKWRTDVDGSVTGTPGWGYYEMVVIPTTWSVPTYIVDSAEFTPDFPGADVSGFPFTTTRMRSSGETYAPYATGYKFHSTGNQIDDAKVGLIRPKTEIAITRHQMPYVDMELYESLIGVVNNAPFKLGNKEFDEESILYMNYEIEQRPDVTTGGLTYDVTHHMVANGPVEDTEGNPNSSWNYFVNRSGKWDLVVSTDGGKPPYSTDNFRLAIWPEYV